MCQPVYRWKRILVYLHFPDIFLDNSAAMEIVILFSQLDEKWNSGCISMDSRKKMIIGLILTVIINFKHFSNGAKILLLELWKKTW